MTKMTPLEIGLAGARFLVTQQKDDGSFIYGYNMRTRKLLKGYNLSRHCGTTWSILLAAMHTENEEDKNVFLRTCDKAIKYILSNHVFDFGNYTVTIEKDKIKLGTMALFTLALYRASDVFKDNKYSQIALTFKPYLLGKIDQDGRTFDPVYYTNKNRAKDFVSEYYPGQVVYAMKHLGEEDLCHKLIEWLKDNRDVYFPAKDHWLLQALELIDPGAKKYRKYADRIADELLVSDGWLDEDVGCIAWRTEGLLAHLAMTGSTENINMIKAFMSHQAKTFVPFGREKGAFVSRRKNPITRIDHVQHNISSFFRYHELKTKGIIADGGDEVKP